MTLKDRVEQLEDAAEGVEFDAGTVDVEWRDAAPDERPEGMVWDADERRMSYDFWSAQWDVLDHLEDGDVDIVAFLAGYRSGKTVTGARWILTKALEHPGTRWLAMGIDFQKAHNTTHRVLFEQLPGERTGLLTSGFDGPESSPVVADHNRSHHRLTLSNDSVIVLGAADTWSRYAGDEYAGAWLDEPSHYADLHNILEMVGSRLTASSGPKAQLWTLTGNGYNAAWEILEKREDEDGVPVALDIETVTASVLENPYIDEADKRRLKRQFAQTGREDQALHGGFAAATGLVYKNFSRDTHVIPHAEAVDRLASKSERTEGMMQARWYGYDAGWRDPRVVIEIGRSSYGQVVVLDEFYAEESQVGDAIEWLESNEKPLGTIFCEHEPADIEKIRQAGWHAVKAEKSLDSGISEVRGRLELDDSGRPGLLVSDRCQNLIREFLGYKREHVGTSAAEDHGLDSLRYAVMGEAQNAGLNIGLSFGD